jgi:hypothetical protein
VKIPKPRLSTGTIRRNFESALSTAFRIYGPVREDCIWSYESINESSFHPRVASKIVGLSFLSIVSAWEEYLEGSFLRYMAGAKSESGYSPRLRMDPQIVQLKLCLCLQAPQTRTKLCVRCAGATSIGFWQKPMYSFTGESPIHL